MHKKINKKKRNRYSGKYKAKVAIEAVKEQHTTAQLANKYQISGAQICQWKKVLLEFAPMLYDSNNGIDKSKDDKQLIDDLYREIGQLKYELDWLKKKADLFE